MLLDESVRIGTLTVKNRLVMPPMRTGKASGRHVTDDLVNYYRERAEGSRPGIIIMEHSFIDENGRASDNQLSLATGDMIAEHRRLTEAIHDGGSLAFAQLNHAGSNGIDESVSACQVNLPSNPLKGRPRPLDPGEIRAIEQRFADSAARAVDAGYDGVEIHCAHGYLLDQFYSPLTNRRKDDYGGSLEARARFLLETVERVRAVIGAEVPLAVRLGGADYLPRGATEEDAAETAVLLQAAGIDMIDVSGGMCFYTRPGHLEAGYFSSMSEKIRARVSVPVLLTGGIKKVDDAERMLRNGKADLIGVGRALLKDPLWRENN